jgi:methyl-accepting chemotaxis protein
MKASEFSHNSGETGGRSLSVVIDLWVGSAFIIAMVVCAGVEYLRNPEVPMDELLSHHLLELFLFGLLLWGMSWIVLRVVLIEPIRKIYEHLYRIGGGDHTPLTIQTGVREIGDIVEAVNIMLWRMEQDVDRKALNHAREKVADIREYITDCEGIDHEKLSQLLEQVSTLDKKLHQIGQAGAIKSKQRKGRYWAYPERS